MSSPPPATSPTSPSGSFNLPRKRPSLNITAPVPKRRKPSSVSSASHPLRQTSFPPPESSPPNATSPQRQSSFSPSVSSVGGGQRGRRKRAQTARSTHTAGNDSRSTAGPANTATDANVPDDEDDAEDDADDTLLEGGQLSEAAKKQEQKHIAMLLEAFSEDQLERYSTWRRVKLKKETVRRITNQTLSQSVPASIVTAINGFTKVFVGQIVESARDVQAEWLVAKGEGKAEPGAGSGKTAANGTATSGGQEVTQTNSGATTQETQTSQQSVSAGEAGRFAVEERDRGPLTPDHLREALRRYKKDREGGSAGFQGLSMLGKETTASRAGSRRLFR